MSTLDGGIGRWLRVISILITLLASVAHGDALSTRSKQLHNRLKDTRKHAANDIRKSHTMLYMTHGGGDENYRHSVDDDQSNARRAGRVVALSAALGSLMQGYDTGVIGGALLFIEPEFGLSAKPLLLGMIVTATTMGSIGGTLAASKLSDNIGRRSTMLLASAKFIAASAILSFAPGVKALIAGRLLMGVAIGEASSVVPVYIAECADKRNRGALATIPQLCISSGILLAYTVSLWVSICFRGAWRLMMGMAILPAIAQVRITDFFISLSIKVTGLKLCAYQMRILWRLKSTLYFLFLSSSEHHFPCVLLSRFLSSSACRRSFLSHPDGF